MVTEVAMDKAVWLIGVIIVVLVALAYLGFS